MTTAPELSEAERAVVERFEAATEPEEIRVERVAVAIYEEDRNDGCSPPWDGVRNVVTDDYRRLARAAIAAMEPTS